MSRFKSFLIRLLERLGILSPDNPPAPPVATPAPSPDPPAPAAGGAPADDLDLTATVLVRTARLDHDPRKAVAVARMTAASVHPDKTITAYESVNWSPNPESNGKLTMGFTGIIWAEASTHYIGIFDRLGYPHQTVKTTENITRENILGRVPASGSDVWLWHIAFGGRERTTIRYAGKWP